MGRTVAVAVLAALLGGCIGSTSSVVSATCTQVLNALSESNPDEAMLKFAAAQRTARNNGEQQFAAEIDVLMETARVGDIYGMGQVAIDIDNRCDDVGVDLDRELGL